MKSSYPSPSECDSVYLFIYPVIPSVSSIWQSCSSLNSVDKIQVYLFLCSHESRSYLCKCLHEERARGLWCTSERRLVQMDIMSLGIFCSHFKENDQNIYHLTAIWNYPWGEHLFYLTNTYLFDALNCTNTVSWILKNIRESNITLYISYT